MKKTFISLFAALVLSPMAAFAADSGVVTKRDPIWTWDDPTCPHGFATTWSDDVVVSNVYQPRCSGTVATKIWSSKEEHLANINGAYARLGKALAQQCGSMNEDSDDGGIGYAVEVPQNPGVIDAVPPKAPAPAYLSAYEPMKHQGYLVQRVEGCLVNPSFPLPMTSAQ